MRARDPSEREGLKAEKFKILCRNLVALSWLSQSPQLLRGVDGLLAARGKNESRWCALTRAHLFTRSVPDFWLDAA